MIERKLAKWQKGKNENNNEAEAHGLGPNPWASLPETRSVKKNLNTHCITKTQSYYISKVLNKKILIEWKKMAWDGM